MPHIPSSFEGLLQAAPVQLRLSRRRSAVALLRYTADPRAPTLQRPGWFPGGQLNTAYNCLDRHVAAGYGHRPAFHHYSPLPQAKMAPKRSMTYAEALEETKVLAGVLQHKLGVKKGDRVIIYVRVG